MLEVLRVVRTKLDQPRLRGLGQHENPFGHWLLADGQWHRVEPADGPAFYSGTPVVVGGSGSPSIAPSP